MGNSHERALRTQKGKTETRLIRSKVTEATTTAFVSSRLYPVSPRSSLRIGTFGLRNVRIDNGLVHWGQSIASREGVRSGK
jgi:hypothetical protein